MDANARLMKVAALTGVASLDSRLDDAERAVRDMPVEERADALVNALDIAAQNTYNKQVALRLFVVLSKQQAACITDVRARAVAAWTKLFEKVKQEDTFPPSLGSGGGERGGGGEGGDSSGGSAAEGDAAATEDDSRDGDGSDSDCVVAAPAPADSESGGGGAGSGGSAAEEPSDAEETEDDGRNGGDGSDSDWEPDEEPAPPRSAEKAVPVKVLNSKVWGRGHQYLCALEGGREAWLRGTLLRESYSELLEAFGEGSRGGTSGGGGGSTSGASSSRDRAAVHVSQYEKLSRGATAKEKCAERGCEAAGVLMDGVWENLRKLMRSEHRGAMQSRNEGDGRDHWCMRFCHVGEYKDTKVMALQHESLRNFNIFVSREHAYAPKKRKRNRVDWPAAGRKRADACIWLRRRSPPRLGLESPTLLWDRDALDAELERGGLRCALVLEFKYDVKIQDDDEKQAVDYCNGISKLLQIDYPDAPSLAVPGYVNVYLGRAETNTDEGANRSAKCEYGVRMNENIADIDADSIS